LIYLLLFTRLLSNNWVNYFTKIITGMFVQIWLWLWNWNYGELLNLTFQGKKCSNLYVIHMCTFRLVFNVCFICVFLYWFLKVRILYYYILLYLLLKDNNLKSKKKWPPFSGAGKFDFKNYFFEQKCPFL
jgi:hypothetical protein